MKALMEYFDEHVSQGVATEKGVPDKILVRLVFNQEGELAEVKVLEGVDAATDAEAVRVMKNIPRSVSEKLKGDTIAMAFTVPVKFSVAPLKEGMRQSGSGANVPRLEDYRYPEFPGGETAFIRFLQENMRYPQEAREKGIEGKVIVKFAVDDETGEILNPRVIRSVHPALDAEALRLVKAMPRWTWAGDPSKKKLRSVETVRAIEFKLGGKNTSQVYDMVKDAPEFPGGTKAMMEYLKTNMRYPQIAKENGIQGRVILQFVVDETGKVTDPKILRGVDPALDLEAIRLVEAMPQWTPGKQDGKAVAVRYTVPVSFKLDSEGEASSQDGVISIKAVVSNELYEHTGILGIGSCKTGSSVSPDSVLFLIDGVPATQETFRALSPDKIASISVLKEEKAQVILDKHGKKGMKGVIMIATKDAAAQSQQ